MYASAARADLVQDVTDSNCKIQNGNKAMSRQFWSVHFQMNRTNTYLKSAFFFKHFLFHVRMLCSACLLDRTNNYLKSAIFF